MHPKFTLLSLSEGTVSARANGHGNDVLREFHAICSILLGSQGPWRIVHVAGSCLDTMELDSDMEWILIARLK